MKINKIRNTQLKYQEKKIGLKCWKVVNFNGMIRESLRTNGLRAKLCLELKVSCLVFKVRQITLGDPLSAQVYNIAGNNKQSGKPDEFQGGFSTLKELVSVLRIGKRPRNSLSQRAIFVCLVHIQDPDFMCYEIK